MTKTDRAKMVKRATECFSGNHLSQMFTEDIVVFCAREVDRAVRAERKVQRDTEELWASHRRRADEQIIERAKGLGRKRQ